jgi:hypothetical protein
LKAEIEGAGGEASVFAADSIGAWSDDELVNAFRQSREKAYGDLTRELERIVSRPGKGRRAKSGGLAGRRRLEAFRARLQAAEAVDFFGSAGRDRVGLLLAQLEARVSPGLRPPPGQATGVTRDEYRARLWVTRPRPGVDRMASAWLIRRLIDTDARFSFVVDRAAVPPETVPFDMFGVEFSHHGAHCTFETLCRVFSIDDPAVGCIAGIVHDLDLKDGLFSPPEAPTVGALIEGLQATYADDDSLLAQGMTLFEALYRAQAQSARRTGPRPVARRRALKRR